MQPSMPLFQNIEIQNLTLPRIDQILTSHNSVKTIPIQITQMLSGQKVDKRKGRDIENRSTLPHQAIDHNPQINVPVLD